MTKGSGGTRRAWQVRIKAVFRRFQPGLLAGCERTIPEPFPVWFYLFLAGCEQSVTDGQNAIPVAQLAG